MSGKYALIIGNTEYNDPGLGQLIAPGRDAEDFAQVLRDSNICAFDDVKVLLNQLSITVIEAIDEFFDDKKPSDLLVLYFSGHGLRDEMGSLYLAFGNTIRSRLRSSAIKSDYIREAMNQSRSKRQVVILDCCNSGAFLRGAKAEVGGTMGMLSAFQGYGRYVLTASDEIQFAWEGDKIIGQTDNSLFTHFLLKGLQGDADLDSDGRITVDELYDYTFDQISKVTPKQTPRKDASKQEGEIVLRQITRIEDIKPVALPDDLISEIEDLRPSVREWAVQRLVRILRGKNIGMARTAKVTLEKIALEDDSRRVSQTAAQALESFNQEEKQAEEERKAREEAERLAALRAEEERLAREKEEAEQRAREEAEKLQRAKAAREAAEREAARLKAEREAAEEEARQAAEKAAREKEEKETAEREAAQKAEQEALELAARKRAEREAAEKAEREAIQLAARRKAEREAAEKTPPSSGKKAIPWIAIPSPTLKWAILGVIVLCALITTAWGMWALSTPGVPTPTGTSVVLAPIIQATTPPPTESPTSVPTLIGGGNGQIVFASLRDEPNPDSCGICNSEIYVMNTGGSHVIRLTNNQAEDIRPAWSPDGKQIAFVSTRNEPNPDTCGGNCNYEIYIMNADGSGQTRLTNNAATDSRPAWSPDGKLIAFQSFRDENLEIYVMNADGTQQTRMTNNPAADYRPTWSPDGKYIAFQSNRDESDPSNCSPTCNMEIYLMNADGSGQIRLTNNQAFDYDPAWSPDGKKIAFISDRDEPNRDTCGSECIDEMYVMNADGSEQTRLTNNATDEFLPAWSPDSERIAFVTFRDEPNVETCTSCNSEIYVINADGSRPVRLTRITTADYDPSWQPTVK